MSNKAGDIVTLLSKITLAIFLLLTPGWINAANAQPAAELHPVATLAEEADTARVLNEGAVEPLILISSDAQKKLQLFSFKNGAATKVAEGTSLGHIWAATLFGSGKDAQVLVAYGLGRGDLNAPLRLVSYSMSLANETTIYTFPTERSQMNYLKADEGHVTAAYFVSKYETETGRLTPVSSNNWRYEKAQSVRMGTSVAASGDLLMIGRMYGDVQGQDGDLLLKKGKDGLRTLPSYRGVSSLSFYRGNGPAAQLLIGDGWHSNYGQLAQGRLSLLTPISGTDRYSLDLLHIFPGSYAVNRISPSGTAPADPVILATNNHLITALPGASWTFKDLYTQQNTNAVFDAQFVAKSGATIFVLISDGKISLYKF